MTQITDKRPFEAGFSMPARFAPHQRSFVGWPRKASGYRSNMELVQYEHAACARAIARFEPCTVTVDPEDFQSVKAEFASDENIMVLEIPSDDGWIRDNGPIFVTRPDGELALVDFAFNGWGKFDLHHKDNAAPPNIAKAMDVDYFSSPMVLEGGGFGVDGEGTLIATEQFLLNPNRNPDMSREQIEQELHDTLGIEKVIWLGYGLVEDGGTDGHIDNVAQFIEPGVILLQTIGSSINPNYPALQENRRRLNNATDARGRKIEVIELDILPYTDLIESVAYPVPYVNYYIVNGGVIMPLLGGKQDDVALRRLEPLFPGREIVGVPSTAIAVDGGGIGCITQQMPHA